MATDDTATKLRNIASNLRASSRIAPLLRRAADEIGALRAEVNRLQDVETRRAMCCWDNEQRSEALARELAELREELAAEREAKKRGVVVMHVNHIKARCSLCGRVTTRARINVHRRACERRLMVLAARCDGWLGNQMRDPAFVLEFRKAVRNA